MSAIDHAANCHQPAPHVQHLLVADAPYQLESCTHCGAQALTKIEETP